MTKTLCALRSGGDYKPEHVQWLAKQVPGLVCLSDVPVEGVPTIPLDHEWPGWWSKMEAFRPDIAGDVWLIDLDTVVLKMPPEPSETTVLQDFSYPNLMGSGFMYIKEADRRRVWDAWIQDPQRHMAECKKWPRWGDQGFLQDHIGNAAKWGGNVRSYKVHCQTLLPENTDVVCFHGKPRPWDIAAWWVPPLEYKNDFRQLIIKHAGARVLVMGGAPSLKQHLEGVEADLVISCNGHGVEFRTPDYAVAMDTHHTGTGQHMGDLIRGRTDVPIISPMDYADYRLPTWLEYPATGVLTGMVAAWVAWVLGAKVVILAGMDGYSGDSSAMERARVAHRDIKCPVRVVGGGPLTKYFPIYDSSEEFMEYEPHPTIDALRGVDGMTRIRVLKPCTVGMMNLEKGQEVTVMRHEVLRLLRHRMVEEVKIPEPVSVEPESNPEPVKPKRGRPPKAAE